MSEIVKVYHARFINKAGVEMLNFGDEISAPFINWIFKVQGIKNKKAIAVFPKAGTDYDMLAAGSVLQWAKNRTTKTHVWGSGIISDVSSFTSDNFEIHAIRGPKTLEKLGNMGGGCVCGDPGLLASLVFNFERVRNKSVKIGLIPHRIHQKNPKINSLLEDKRFFFIDVNQSPDKVAADIVKSDLVLSSSLHGLIFADSYNIPNLWFRLENKLIGDDFKFRDYFMSIERTTTEIDIGTYDFSEDNVQKAIQEYQPIKNLELIQKRLIDVYPVEVSSKVKGEENSFITDLLLKEIPDEKYDRVLVYSGVKNLVELALLDKEAKNYLKNLSNKGFIVNNFKAGFTYLVRKENSIIPKSFVKFNKRLPYKLDFSLAMDATITKLIVLFSNVQNLKVTNAVIRNISSYPIVKKISQLNENVAILSLCDFNLVYGSVYRNTTYYPEFECDIQSLIRFIIELKLNISKNNVILYGEGKGGGAAIYHGALGDYNTLVCNPILDFSEINHEQNDKFYLEGCLENNFLNSINKISKTNQFRKIIIENDESISAVCKKLRENKFSLYGTKSQNINEVVFSGLNLVLSSGFQQTLSLNKTSFEQLKKSVTMANTDNKMDEAMMKINIMTACNEGYAKYILPQLVSIQRNLSEYKVNFFLLHNRITAESIELIKSFSNAIENIDFYSCYISDNIEKYELLVSNAGNYPYEVFFPLTCQDFLPEWVDRVLYIHSGDVIFLKDICNFYFSSFNGKSLTVEIANKRAIKSEQNGQVFFWKADDRAEFIKSKKTDPAFFSSAAFMINVEKFREQNHKIDYYLKIREEVISYLSEVKNGMYYLGDQSFFSIAFLGDINAFLPITDFNSNNINYRRYNYSAIVKFLRSQFRLSEVIDPRVIHYDGKFKPWIIEPNFFDNRIPINIKDDNFQIGLSFRPVIFRDYYEKYWDFAKETPLYHEMLKEAKLISKYIRSTYIPVKNSLIIHKKRVFQLEKKIKMMNNE